jgi:glucose 1-dehydrogenase
VTRRFEGSRCLVAGSGPGADAIAERLRSEGGRVVALDRPADLTSDAGATSATAGAVTELGGLDVLVTAFSTREDRPFLDIDDDSWRTTLDENLKAAFLVGREAARTMVKAGGGVIVHVGSHAGACPGPSAAAYAASKAGVHLLTTGMALDLAPHGVRVCAVAEPREGPAPYPVPPPGIDDLAAAVAFCASKEASYVMGSTFFLDGPLPLRG